jgi:hypothetical protein
MLARPWLRRYLCPLRSISPEEGDQSRNQEGPRDQRVEQEADEEHGANLTEALDRDQHHGREGDGEDQPGDRDRSLGARPGAAYRGFSGPSAAALQIRLIRKTL